MKDRIKYKLSPLLLLVPLSIISCQQDTQKDNGLAGTHPELAEDLAEDSMTVPYNDSSDLYNRYRISTEQYMNSGDYGVGNMYRGNLAPLDEKSHEDARTYRSMLRQGLEEGVNFAGKYTVVSIGCGTSCQQHFVVDRESGKVLDKVQSSMGAKYSTNSRVLIVNPPDSAVNYNECNYCTPEAYVFENGKFRKLEQQQK
ncbi:hypothetical protein POKO110462_07010 [Pontibacter korlensis]|uniref:hypothetical protein n=1 Tax=Pontibacter korlensis TaxID=400092 RepID=UPI000697AFFA|nr:hypothetical protein [Pontibacter korlensis]